MPTGGSMLWTNPQVDETVTSAYIHSHLRAIEQDILKRPVYFGGDLTDENYLDWILGRAKRFFLILVATGVPDQIFGIVDDSFDDDDLPIAEDAVPDLRLSFEPDQALDKRFYRTQFKFLTRILEDGEHIRYAEEETVPITPLGLKSVISFNKEGVDTVKLPSDPSKTFIRRRINLESSRLTEEGILAEIAGNRKFSHEHVVSVFGSYLQNNTVTILSLPAPDWTLRSFLMDTPKSFESLPKAQRRRTLMNWPHCLANALSWLHANGGHHGAIRPGNVHVNQDYQVCLGPLEGESGESVLTISTKSDDIESYQYAPPERWKRAVTVQSTGSGKMALPSGGRSARKAPNDPHDPADPSTRKWSGSSSGIYSMDGMSYAFMPASKSETYTRFRLSTAINTDAVLVPPPRRSRNAVPEVKSNDSRSTTRATNDRGPLTRAPSVLSQTSSEGRLRAQTPRGIFAATPENRTAVVQTWRDVSHNSFAADVFSLGAVILDILTVLCKRTYSSFTRFRSSKNRNAGRGGGLADASFHANLGQVMLWAEQISIEAEKKIRKQRGEDIEVLRAVGAVIQVTVQCLERNPDARLSSALLEQRLGEHIKKFANIDPLHCVAQMPERTPRIPARQRALEEPSPLLSPIHMRSEGSSSRLRHATIKEEPPSWPSTTYSPSTRPTTSRTLVPPQSLPRSPPQSPPSISLTSLPSLNFEVDGGSDTVVGGQEQSRGSLVHQRSHQPKDMYSPRELHAPEVSPPKQERWEYTHGNESAVDPRLTLSTDGSEPGSASFYITYSASSSEDGEEGTTYHYPLPPAKPPPRGPPPPRPSTNPRAPERAPAPVPRHRYEPSTEEIAMLRQLSQTAIGGHPPRMSSLNPSQSEEDDEQAYRERAGKKPPIPAALKNKGDRRQRVYRARS